MDTLKDIRVGDIVKLTAYNDLYYVAVTKIETDAIHGYYKSTSDEALQHKGHAHNSDSCGHAETNRIKFIKFIHRNKVTDWKTELQ